MGEVASGAEPGRERVLVLVEDSVNRVFAWARFTLSLVQPLVKSKALGTSRVGCGTDRLLLCGPADPAKGGCKTTQDPGQQGGLKQLLFTSTRSQTMLKESLIPGSDSFGASGYPITLPSCGSLRSQRLPSRTKVTALSYPKELS